MSNAQPGNDGTHNFMVDMVGFVRSGGCTNSMQTGYCSAAYEETGDAIEVSVRSS